MIILAPFELFASINIELLDIVALVSSEKVLEVSFIFPALRVVPLIFPRVTPPRIVPVESWFAVAPAAAPLFTVPAAVPSTEPVKFPPSIVALLSFATFPNPIPALFTCPLPAPLKVPFAFIVIPEFVKVVILFRPVPPFDAGKVLLPIKVPSSSMAPAAIFAAVIVFADSLSASIVPVVIFPPSIVVVFALIIVAGLYPVIAPLLPLVNDTGQLNPIS